MPAAPGYAPAPAAFAPAPPQPPSFPAPGGFAPGYAPGYVHGYAPSGYAPAGYAPAGYAPGFAPGYAPGYGNGASWYGAPAQAAGERGQPVHDRHAHHCVRGLGQLRERAQQPVAALV